jgi:DDE superfamily endonuclease
MAAIISISIASGLPVPIGCLGCNVVIGSILLLWRPDVGAPVHVRAGHFPEKIPASKRVLMWARTPASISSSGSGGGRAPGRVGHGEGANRPGCRIKLHFIPSYCPHLNPIERLWGLMHRNVTHNKCYATCAQFADATLSFLRETVPRNWADLCDSVTDNFRVINPKVSGYEVNQVYLGGRKSRSQGSE